MKSKTQTIGFFVLLGLGCLVVFKIFLPFWQLLAYALILTVLFYPLYSHLEKRTKSPNLTAGFVVTMIALIVAGPLLFIGQQIFFQLADVYRHLNLGNLASQPDAFINSLPESVRNVASTFNFDFAQWLQHIATQGFNSLSGFVSSLGWFFGSLVVVAFSTFFLLRDAEIIKKTVSDLLPLSSESENLLFTKVSNAVNGVVKGQFLVALIQATASFVGFLIFGVPNALLWASLVILAAFVPTIGTGLVLIPAVGYLYFTGHTGQAIGMAIWGWACVGLIDNVLAAKLVSSRVRLHPILTIFAILGGVTLFGVFGVLLGPIIMSIFVALVEIYRIEMK